MTRDGAGVGTHVRAPAPTLDHTAFAVPDALAVARTLRAELGAVPVVGEVLPEFRYLTMYVGTARRGANIELLEPAGPGFLSRFLDRHGTGPHHITFTVPDLSSTVAEARALGLTVVGESYEHAPWQEAFIAPDGVHSTVIQLACSDRAYPSPSELLATRERRPADCPSSLGATDPTWWESVWGTAPRGGGRLGATLLGTADMEMSHRLFGALLGGSATVSAVDGAVRFSWPTGAVLVHATGTPGIRGMELVGGPAGGISLGPARLGS